MKTPYTLLISCGQLLIMLLAPGIRADDVPVAPIRPGLNQGITNSFRLQNDFLDVVIDPETGRLAYISYHEHDNIFALDTPAAARSVSGGERLYPLAPEQFKAIQHKNPELALKNGPWSSRAWVSADGTQICLLTREYPAPLELKCSRKIMLYKNEPAVHVRQRVERVGRSTRIPSALWNVVRIQPPSRVILPLDPEKKLRPFDGAPEKKSLFFAPGAAVLKTSKTGPAILGTSSTRQWVAAEINDLVVIARTRSEAGLGAFPDNCTARVNWPAAADHAQLENFSRRRRLQAGEKIENTFMLEFHLTQRDLSDAHLARAVRQMLGEAPRPKTPRRVNPTDR